MARWAVGVWWVCMRAWLGESDRLMGLAGVFTRVRWGWCVFGRRMDKGWCGDEVVMKRQEKGKRSKGVVVVCSGEGSVVGWGLWCEEGVKVRIAKRAENDPYILIYFLVLAIKNKSENMAVQSSKWTATEYNKDIIFSFTADVSQGLTWINSATIIVSPVMSVHLAMKQKKIVNGQWYQDTAGSNKWPVCEVKCLCSSASKNATFYIQVAKTVLLNA